MDRMTGPRPPWTFPLPPDRRTEEGEGASGPAAGRPTVPEDRARGSRPPWTFRLPPDWRREAGERAAAAEAVAPAESALTSGAGVRGIRNSALVLGAQLGSRLLALGTVIVILHSLGAGAFGEMQTAVTYGAIVGVVADMGLSTLLVREGARRPRLLGRYLDNLFSLRIPMAAVAVLVLIGVLWLIGLHSLIVASAALLVVSGLQVLLRNAFYALQQVRFVAVEIVPEALLLLALVVFGAVHHLGTAYFIWAYALSYLAAALYFAAVLLLIGAWRPRWRFEREMISSWMLLTLPLAVSYIFTTVYWQIDVPILQHFGPATPTACPTRSTLAFCEVGWYQAAYKPFQALLVIPFALRTVVFPILSVYHREAPARLREAARKLFKALFALGLPISLGVVILAGQYTSLLSLYPEASPALRLLGVTVMFMFVDNANAATLLAIDRQGTYARIVGAGMVANIALNAALIPVLEAVHPGSGYWVASGTTAVTEMLLVVLGLTALRRYGVSIPLPRLTARILPAAAVMGGLLLLARPAGRVATVGMTIAAGAVYLAALWAFRAVDAEERSLIRRALRRA